MAEAVRAIRLPSGWTTEADYEISFEPSPRRVRAVFGGETVADSTGVMVLLESKHLPVYYFPKADVRMDLLTPTEHSTHCPHKGDASYWTIEAGGKAAENAVWGYPTPFPQLAVLKDYVAFYWNRMDHWYEEDEEVFVHARDPHKRIDVVDSKRPVKVVVKGETVAETVNARFLFETDLPTRYYIPREDVRMDLLEPTESRTQCPYKGEATYWSAKVGGAVVEDVAWSYPEPIPECPRIKGLICFYNEVVDEIFVGGQAVPKVKTKWSRD